MASNSETGHAKNVANFKELITIVKSYGQQYQPTAANLKVPMLEAQAELGELSLNKLKEAETLAKQANAALKASFLTLNTFCSQLISLLNSSGAKASSVDEARAVQKRITGANSKKKKAENGDVIPEDAKSSRSVSRQSYDSRLDDFEKLVMILQNIPEYQPNEEAFKVTTLQRMILSMKELIENNDEKDVMRSQAMNERNKVLYTPETGVVDTALKVKSYIKAIFGGIKSNEYKAVSKIKIAGKLEN